MPSPKAEPSGCWRTTSLTNTSPARTTPSASSRPYCGGFEPGQVRRAVERSLR